MATLTENSNSLRGLLSGLVSDKPKWVSIVVYTACIVLCLGLVYLLMHLLIAQWWVAVVVVTAIGTTCGMFAYQERAKQE